MNLILKQIISRLLIHPVKSILTILSISLGVMIVILVLNMNFKLSSLMDDSNSNTIINVLNGIEINQWDIDRREIDISSEEIISDLKLSLEGIKNISPIMPWADNIFYYMKDKYSVKKAYGTEPAYLDMFNIDIIEGSSFQKGEDVMEVIISDEIRDILFQTKSAIGQIISTKEELKDDNDTDQIIFKDYTIVGVYKTPIPIVKEKDGIPDLIYSNSNGSQLIVEFEKGFTENSKIKLKEALKSILEPEVDLIIWNGRPNDTEEKLWYESIITLIKISFVIFALIALLVSSFGVFSMTTVSILERTKEIGLKRALGGNRQDIIKQFLLEAVVTILIGSILGIILAMLFSPLFISNVLPSITGGAIDLSVGMNMSLNPMAVFLSVLVSVISGGIFGLFPSLTAAKSQPIEAIKEN